MKKYQTPRLPARQAETKYQNPDFEKALREEKFYLRTVFIGTYVSRRCGIATYTRDLTAAINILNPYYPAEIMALDDPEREPVDYPWETKFRIIKDNEKSYLEAAEYLNKSSCDLVCLQHEFGIFGGEDGDLILNLVRNLKKPLIVTFHTTMKDPKPHQKYLIQKLAKSALACVVMIKEADRRLREIYQVPEEKIVVIHHGVPNVSFSPSYLYKNRVGFKKGDFLVGSINLIAKNKGLEYVLEALQEVKTKIPKIKFLMIGQTHPMVKIKEDEKYRYFLRRLAKKLGLEKNFLEINKYLPLGDLTNYLKSLDIYITPYLDLNQTSSGTLAYALGAGKVCISTPYIYAKEVLANGRGILVPVAESKMIAKSFLKVWQDSKFRAKIEKKAYKFGRKMIWYRVALNYLNLFDLVLKKVKN